MDVLSFQDKIYVSVYDYLNSNCYILMEKNNAVIVDPQENNDIEDLFVTNNIHDVLIILTHEHPDHISGLWWFIKKFNCKIICSKICAELIANKRYTRPTLITFMLEQEDEINGTNRLEQFQKEYVWTTYKTDITYEKSMCYSWQKHSFDFYSIKGHSDGGSLIIMDDKYAFTGDSLVKQYPVILSFPRGNKKAYIEETLPLFEKVLNSDMTILPGHGEPFVLSDIMIDGKIKVEIR